MLPMQIYIYTLTHMQICAGKKATVPKGTLISLSDHFCISLLTAAECTFMRVE